MSYLMGVWEVRTGQPGIFSNSHLIFAFVQGLVQYNDEQKTVGDISEVCSRLNAGYAKPLETYANITLSMLLQPGQCLDFSYKSALAALANISYSDSGSYGYRQWFFQSCTEFGYFVRFCFRVIAFRSRLTSDSRSKLPTEQTSHSEPWYPRRTGSVNAKTVSAKRSTPLSESIPLIFIMEATQSAPATWTVRGQNHLAPSCFLHADEKNVDILFVNGNIDPWSSLSILTSVSSTVQAIIVNGTAHCADQIPDSRDRNMQLAYQKISAQLGSWLAAHYRKYRLKL